jgi:hypothetical protein
MVSQVLAGTLAAFLAATSLAQPLTTAVTFQGQLDSAGTPVSGTYDLRFTLFDSAVGGAQVGPQLCSDNISIANGRFTVQLDFGAQFAGSQRFLEVAAREDTGLACAVSTGFVTLSPRQNLTAAPNAVFALSAASAGAATNATQLNGQPASFYTSATNLNSGTIPDARLGATVARLDTSQTFTGALTLSNPANIFSGNGAGLSGLNAGNLATGILPDARLSTNVALLSGAQTFAGAKTFTAPTYLNGFVGIGTTTAIGSANFVMSQNTSAYGGMYINTTVATGWPFYGYAQNGSVAAFHYIDGADSNKWKLVNNGVTALTVTQAGELGIGTGTFSFASTPCKVAAVIPATKTFGIFGGTPSGGAPGAGPGQVPALWVDTGSLFRTAEFTSTTQGAGVSAVLAQSNGGEAAIIAFGVNGAYAAEFSGNVQVIGNLSKNGGSFKIDHPLDPANKYLSHSFVESPDMMNIYNGNVTTDARGYATVTFPDWFEALNRDFRYQLTVIDESDSDDAVVWAKVVRKIKDRTFTIRSSRPNVEVSWQVTGIRHDVWANAHRIPVEEDKSPQERGLFLTPTEWGQPKESGISFHNQPAPADR